MHAFGPLTVDMYLPALPSLESVFAASTAQVQWTLSTFFLGFTVGQTLWGPIADRFGRRVPLYFSMLLFLATSAACALAPSITWLAILRTFQAVGACGASVIARAIVRDLFPPTEMRHAFSILIMLNAVAPAIAPLLGGALLAWSGWQSIFWMLAAVGLAGTAIVHFFVPESLDASAVQPLHLGHVFRSYGGLLANPRFLGSTLVTGLSSAGMFAYIAGSPFVFINMLKISPQQFAAIFGSNALGIILVSHINTRFLFRYSTEHVLKAANLIQLAAGIALTAAAAVHTHSTLAIWIPLFVYVSMIGLTFPNGSAIALADHGKIAGIASALLGTNQFGLAVVSTMVLGAIPSTSAIPMAIVILVCGALATLLNFALVRPQPASSR